MQVLARRMGVFFLILWAAAPASLLGLFVGLLGLATGGAVRRRGRVLEFHGGWVTRFLAAMPIGPTGAAAMTLGHVVLGQNPGELFCCREHELVHVRQYERWGPLFLPLYLGASVLIWFRSGDPYRDNPFEREAYAEDHDANHP